MLRFLRKKCARFFSHFKPNGRDPSFTLCIVHRATPYYFTCAPHAQHVQWFYWFPVKSWLIVANRKPLNSYSESYFFFNLLKAPGGCIIMDCTGQLSAHARLLICQSARQSYSGACVTWIAWSDQYIYSHHDKKTQLLLWLLFTGLSSRRCKVSDIESLECKEEIIITNCNTITKLCLYEMSHECRSVSCEIKRCSLIDIRISCGFFSATT